MKAIDRRASYISLTNSGDESMLASRKNGKIRKNKLSFTCNMECSFVSNIKTKYVHMKTILCMSVDLERDLRDVKQS